MTRRPVRPGATLVELLVVIGLVAVLAGLTLSGVQRVRWAAAAAGCRNNLRQVGLALHQHHDARRAFPAGTQPADADRPFQTWLTPLLPHVEQGPLWAASEAAYRAERLFGRPAHEAVRTQVVPAYVCPADERTAANPQPENTRHAFTHYLGVAGSRPDDGCLYRASRVGLAQVTDGASNTLLAGERPPSPDERFGWWYAGIGQRFDGAVDSHLLMRQLNLTYYAPTCPYGPYRYGPGDPDDPCDMFHFWSRHPGGAHFVLCDGAVRFIRYEAEPVMNALATRAGGEAGAPPD